MNEKKTDDQATAETKSGLMDEPMLFEEKIENRGKWRKRLFLFALIGLILLFLLPKGYISGEAVVQAKRFAKLDAGSNGVLKELLHQKGDYVRKGDVLARFESPELTRKIEDLKLRLKIAYNARASFLRELQYCKREKDRKRILYENDAVGESEFEKAKLDYFKSRQALRSCQKGIELLQDESRFLKAKTKRLELKAPFDGVLLTDPSNNIENVFKEGDFLLEFADPKTFYLEILIPEKQIERVRVGNEATLHFNAFPDERYGGEVTKIASRTSEEIEKVFNVKHVVACEITVRELPSKVKYGMRAWVRVRTRHPDLRLPKSQKPEEILNRLVNFKIPETKKAEPLKEE